MNDQMQSKLEARFKVFCFVVAVLQLILIFLSLVKGIPDLTELFTLLGLFLTSISMGVLMSYEDLSAQVSLNSFFKKQEMILSPVGMVALILGRVGTIFLIIPILVSVVIYFS